MIREKINQILDRLPEQELERLYWLIANVQKSYTYKQNLYDKGVVISELYEEAERIIDQWDKTFSQNVSEEIKEAIYYSQYKWHIFSYEQQACLKGDLARRAFDNELKDELYVMYENLPALFLYKHASNVVAADFDTEQDIYIFDRNFTWTYIHTHESMCGPYFLKV